MTEKELLKQLNSLNNFEPDLNWKNKNRELLISQIIDQGGVEDKKIRSFTQALMLHLELARNLSQQFAILILIVFFGFGSGIWGLRASRDSKPGDSLYIAKLVSEKTQLAFTFDEKGKARLGIEFASNRADEIEKVLADEKSDVKQEKVAELVNSFKKEIVDVRARLVKINPEKVAQNNTSSQDNNVGQSTEEESFVFSANLEKDKNGIDIAEKNITESPKATTSAEKVNIPQASPKEILSQAGELLKNEDYSATLNKLDEADSSIDIKIEAASSTQGQVLGAEEAATSTEE